MLIICYMNINNRNMKYASAGIWTRGTSLASSRVARLHHTRFNCKIQQGIYILTLYRLPKRFKSLILLGAVQQLKPGL